MKAKPRIGIIGFGRMGQTIARLAQERGWPQPLVVDPGADAAFSTVTDAPLDSVDVCIEFTQPATAPDNVLAILAAGTPVVSGTTGWDARIDEVRREVLSQNGTFLHAHNFSIGAYLFSELVRKAAELMSAFPQYDLALHESHHRGKKDIPSGTANTLAKRITDVHPHKRNAALLPLDGPLDPETLYISASRIGLVFGEHQLTADSEADSITMTHRAKGRLGFAEGALTAAQWIIDKHGFFTLEDMIHDLTTA